MSVYKRGNSWYINITLGGVRLHRKVGNKRSEAVKIKEEIKTKYRLGQFSIRDITEKTPFAIAAEAFLEYTQKTKSKRTYEMDHTDYLKHLQPFFTGYDLQDISNDALLTFQSRQSEHYSNRTVNIHISLVRKIMRHAEKKNLIGKSELHFPMLREPKRMHAYFTPQEFTAIVQHITDNLTRKRIQLGYFTGMRPRELAFLSWDDIDFSAKNIMVRSKPKSGFCIKTDEERIIPIGKQAIAILRSINKKGRWVFSETAIPVLDIRKAIKTAAVRSGITKTVTPGMLRHTFATHALMAGADIQAVQSILGHKDLSTTTRYTHTLEESSRRTVSLLEKKGLATFSPHQRKRPKAKKL